MPYLSLGIETLRFRAIVHMHNLPATDICPYSSQAWIDSVIFHHFHHQGRLIVHLTFKMSLSQSGRICSVVSILFLTQINFFVLTFFHSKNCWNTSWVICFRILTIYHLQRSCQFLCVKWIKQKQVCIPDEFCDLIWPTKIKIHLTQKKLARSVGVKLLFLQKSPSISSEVHFTLFYIPLSYEIKYQYVY